MFFQLCLVEGLGESTTPSFQRQIVITEAVMWELNSLTWLLLLHLTAIIWHDWHYTSFWVINLSLTTYPLFFWSIHFKYTLGNCDAAVSWEIPNWELTSALTADKDWYTDCYMYYLWSTLNNENNTTQAIVSMHLTWSCLSSPAPWNLWRHHYYNFKCKCK